MENGGSERRGEGAGGGNGGRLGELVEKKALVVVVRGESRYETDGVDEMTRDHPPPLRPFVRHPSAATGGENCSSSAAFLMASYIPIVSPDTDRQRKQLGLRTWTL